MQSFNSSGRYESTIEKKPRWVRDAAWVKAFTEDYLASHPNTPWLDKLVWRFAARVSKRAQVIPPSGVDLYMLRVHTMTARAKLLGKSFRVHLNHFFRSDQDRDPHNHPWEVSYAFILTGGYIEYRLNEKTGEFETRKMRPGSFNVIKRDDFHRVELLDPANGCWTIFITVNRVPEHFGYEWSFKNMKTGELIPWGQYKSVESVR